MDFSGISVSITSRISQNCDSELKNHHVLVDCELPVLCFMIVIVYEYCSFMTDLQLRDSPVQMQRKVNDLQKEFCELHNNFRASCKQIRGSLSWSKYARRMLALLLLQENHLKLKNSAEKLHKKREFHNSHTQKKRSTCSAVTLVWKEIKRGSPEFDPQKKRSKCSAVTG